MEFSTNPAESKRPNFNFSKNILDVKLYRDPDSQYIFIGFDLITKSCTGFMKLPLNIQRHITLTHDIEEKILKNIWENAEEEEKTFLSSDYEIGVVIDHKSKLNIPKSSIYYQLPTNPNAALNWLGAFVLYLNQDTKGFCIHFKDYTQDTNDNDFYQGVTEVESMQTYQTENNVNSTVHKLLIEAILSLTQDNTSDCYADTKKAIEALYTKYCEDRAKKIYINFIAYINPIAYIQIKNEQTIKNVLTTAINKPAHDGGKYSLDYVEFDFLLCASFSMTQDGKLSIVDLDKNSAYMTYYAPGKRNETIFEPELIFLANTLGLAFEKDNFKENGIVFNPASTQKLLDKGIVCIEETTQDIKNEKYAQSVGSFFSTKMANKPNMNFNFHGAHEKIYEVKSNAPISKELPEETQKQLQAVKSCLLMIQDKSGDTVTGTLDFNTFEVTFSLFNGYNGGNTNKVDGENIDVIKLSKTFGAKISKVPHETYSYWSYSHITLPYQKIANLKESLILLEDIPMHSKLIAKC